MAWGCPFCHRVLAALHVTSLMHRVTITWTNNVKDKSGWTITPADDPLFAASSLKQVYQQVAPASNRFSVPLMVNKRTKTLVSTDSPTMVRFIASGFNGHYPVDVALLPASLEHKINIENAWLHENVNRAVYLVGFAEQASEYEARRKDLFNALDLLDGRLAKQDYLHGEQLSESDLFLYATLERFDAVYYELFRCNIHRISDYLNLSAYLTRMRNTFGLHQTYNKTLTVEHYFLSTMHVRGRVKELNPSKTIPAHIAKQIY